jgi:hypothetical protein
LSGNDVHQRDDIVNRLVLDIKALVLLSKDDAELSRTVQENIAGSHDEQVSKFVSTIQPSANTGSRRGQFLTALGELVLASFLTIAGLSLLAPSLMGLQSPDQLLSYFKEIIDGISASSFSDPLIPFLDFLFALMLLLGSFYLLRHASVDLKHAGLAE